MNTLTIVALALILFGGIGAILLAIGQAKSASSDKNEIIHNTKMENAFLKGEIQNLQGERIELKKDLETRDRKISDQTEEIISLNRELVKKSEYIANQLTGGNGFPVVLIRPLSPDKNIDGAFEFSLTNSTILPLYDIKVVIYDFDKILKKATKVVNGTIDIKQKEFYASVIHAFEENHIFPKSSITSGKSFQYPDALFFIQISSRSSFVFEKLAFVKVGNQISNGFMICNGDGKVLAEDIVRSASDTARQLINEKFEKIPNRIIFNLQN